MDCGGKAERIPPYKLMLYRDVNGVVNGKEKLCNMKLMAKQIEKGANEMGRDDLVELDPRNYNVPKAVELYEFTP